MQIGLAFASGIERGQLSHETATPASRKTLAASSSAAIKILGATEAQLYTCNVMPGLVCGERAESGQVSKAGASSTPIRRFQKRGEPLAVVMNSQDGNWP